MILLNLHFEAPLDGHSLLCHDPRTETPWNANQLMCLSPLPPLDRELSGGRGRGEKKNPQECSTYYKLHAMQGPSSHPREWPFLSLLLYRWGDSLLRVKYQCRSLPRSRRCNNLSHPEGYSGDGERAARPYYLPQAPRHAAGPHGTIRGRWPALTNARVFWRKTTGFLPQPWFQQGPAGERKAGGSGMNFRPLPGADTSPPRP